MSLVPGGRLQASHQATARQQGRNKQQRERVEIPEEKTKCRHFLIREQGLRVFFVFSKATEVEQ